MSQVFKMSQDSNHIKQYSAEDIQRYLKGTMSAEEMHRLEKQALEDPFLADAIEGMAAAQKENKEELVTTTLEDLRREFAKRIETRGKVLPIRRFGWWKLAAAAMIVIVAGVFAYNTWMQPSREDQLAKTETKITDPFKPESSSSEKESDAQAALQLRDSQVIANRDETNAQRAKKTSVAPGASEGQKETNGTSAQEDFAISKADDKSEAGNQEADKKNDGKEAKDVAAALSGKASGIQKENVQKSESELASVPRAAKRMDTRDQELYDAFRKNNFSGRVVDQYNTPVPNATVQVLNSRNAFLTDKNGNFTIPANDSILDVQIGIVGYQTRNFQLRDNAAMNNVVLEQKNLNAPISFEKVSREKNEYKSKYPAVTVQNAVPKIGWIEYEKYLENNKLINKSDSLIAGDVVVSFQVNRDGVLSNYKIEKSLTKEYDNEALRLVKDGPAWKLIKGNKARVTIIVHF